MIERKATYFLIRKISCLGRKSQSPNLGRETISKEPAQPQQFLKGKKGEDSQRIIKAGVWALAHSPLYGITIPKVLTLPLGGILTLRSACRIAKGTVGDEMVTFQLLNSSF